jgi:hypothetical protein
MTRWNLGKLCLALGLIAVTALPAQAAPVTAFGGNFGQNTLTITLGITGSGITVNVADQNLTFNMNQNSITLQGGAATVVNPARNAFIGTPVAGGGAFTSQYSMNGSNILFSPPTSGQNFDVFYGATGDAAFTFALSDGSVTILPSGAQFAQLEGGLNLVSQNAGVTDDYSLFSNFGGTFSYTLTAAAGETSMNHLDLLQFFTNGAAGTDIGDTFVLNASYRAFATPFAIPEPGSMTLLGIGTITAVGYFRRRGKAG